MDLNNLFLPNHLSVFSLSAYLGPDITDEERTNASTRGESIFIHFGIIPSEFYIPQCHCGRLLYRVSDDTRKLKYRYKNSVGHKISPTKNTFLEYVHTVGELGAHKIVQMAYHWTMKANTSTIQQEVKVSKNTALAFCEYFRDVATKIANKPRLCIDRR
ncbi:hypothetical protein QTP88_020120 [Uroleucon formosanum]